MDMEKVKMWLELTNKYQKDDFWRGLFHQGIPERIVHANDFPLYDIYKSDSILCLIIELPGIDRSDLSVALRHGDTLVVKGISRSLFPADMELKRERFYGEFERLIPLPQPTETKFIHSTFQDGILQVTYPRQDDRTADRQEDTRII
ncbi:MULTISPECIES: Hsp20/alpha crystallin family protein [Mesobacillus]|uniref:HSP20 family protein n=1 Tax=Mesobacillus stamsii TaxID=225347 RepID=A0ABU0FRR7_9BACI|nr:MULTISPECIES: Hsp20/alpha crystallin family protein [Mesobacillus]MDQ0412612.1 HSP20 family protein [Mesobacillus stamsii]